MVDGDKTIIIQDSYRFCCNGKTKIFDGDFYTGYQSFLFEKELQTASIDKSKIAGIDVIIAANVIQNEAVELFKDYLVFATRLSKNSFVGVNQSKQTGKTGPDTADRLFNLIKKRY